MSIVVTSEMAAFNAILGGIKPILQDEYDAARITGTDYANVLFGSIQSSLQMAFAKPNMDLQGSAISADVALKNAQRQTVEDSRAKQIATLDSEIALKGAQKTQFDLYGRIKGVESLCGIGSMAANAGTVPIPDFWTYTFNKIDSLG